MTAAGAEADSPQGKWLFGRGVDLLIGCGLGYLLCIPLLLAVEATGVSSWPPLLVLLMVHLVNAPHYGATLLRVYEARENRARYAVFSVYATLVLALLLAASTRSVWLMSVLITVYVTWSPWHFSGQNYGLALMFLRRAGIAVDPTTKRLFYASFLLSALLAMLAIHSGHEEMVYAPATLHTANTPSVLLLRLPSAVTRLLLAGMALLYLGCLAGVGWRLRTQARLRELTPAVLLVVSQATWFTLPATLLGWHVQATSLVFAAIWIGTAHSLQYLWVTTYYARVSEAGVSTGGFLLKSLVAGAAVVALPLLLLAPQLLGQVPPDAGLAATVFSVVNIHHFILDGAIWKLRDGPIARVLLRAQPVQPKAPAPRGRLWLRRCVWAVAGLAAGAEVLRLQTNAVIGRASPTDSVAPAVEVLRWTGGETVLLQFKLGRRQASAGNHERAIAHFQRSLELFPTAQVFGALGAQQIALGRWDLALSAFDSALELNPDFWGAHHLRAHALLALDPLRTDPNTRAEATASLERALELSPDLPKAAVALAGLYVESGREAEARRTLERALLATAPEDAAPIRRALSDLEASSAAPR